MVGRPPRIALVHDWLNQSGGAEVVLSVMHDMFESAPIYTTIFDPKSVPAAADWDVHTSWIDRLPRVHERHQTYLPLYPLAWDTTHLPDYDVVVSNKSGFCHGVRASRATHVCYCLTPTRYVWEPSNYLAHEGLPAVATPLIRLMLPYLRRWDRAAADRVDHFVAISSTVRDRIAQYYGRTSTVIHPPAELDGHVPSAQQEDAYVVLSRLVPYKRIDLAIAAFNRLGRRLIVVGEGRDMSRLRSLAGPTIEFRGRLPRCEVVHLLSQCRALVWPGVEDYGLVPVEAMASGRPVIARRAGGVLDTVIEGRTGVFFDAPDPDALASAVVAADQVDWQPASIRAHAMQFDRSRFEERFGDYLAQVTTGGGTDD